LPSGFDVAVPGHSGDYSIGIIVMSDRRGLLSNLGSEIPREKA